MAAGLAWMSAAAVAATGLRWRQEDARLALALLLSAVLSTGPGRRAAPSRACECSPTIWCLPAAVLLPPEWAVIALVPLAALACWNANRKHARCLVIALAGAGAGCGAASLAFHAGDALTPLKPEWLAAAAGCGLLQQITRYGLIAVAQRGAGQSRRRPALPCQPDLPSAVAELCTAVLVTFAAAANPWYAVLAVPLAIPLQRSRQHEELARAARTDAKTGLLTAAAWQQAANAEISRGARTRKPVAVAMLDIDHFKKVNDSHGHLAGDRVLAAVASVLTGQLRSYDVAGRFGGEEFAVLLPDTTEADARQIAERLRAQIAATAMVSDGKDGPPGSRVTVSIGVACALSPCTTAEELVDSADRALYAAKEAGRNQVRTAPSALLLSQRLG